MRVRSAFQTEDVSVSGDGSRCHVPLLCLLIAAVMEGECFSKCLKLENIYIYIYIPGPQSPSWNCRIHSEQDVASMLHWLHVFLTKWADWLSPIGAFLQPELLSWLCLIACRWDSKTVSQIMTIYHIQKLMNKCCFFCGSGWMSFLFPAIAGGPGQPSATREKRPAVSYGGGSGGHEWADEET